MASWRQPDPVPPGHGGRGGTPEPLDADAEVEKVPPDLHCWCGRPLRFQYHRASAHTTSYQRWECPLHGYARYLVQRVFPDGNPEVVFRSTELQHALAEADRIREQYAAAGAGKGRVFIGVTDEDDPERGWLDDAES